MPICLNGVSQTMPNFSGCSFGHAARRKRLYKYHNVFLLVLNRFVLGDYALAAYACRSGRRQSNVDRRAQRAFHAFVHCWRLRLSYGCSTCMEQFAGHCHIVVIAADIQETTQDGTVCSHCLLYTSPSPRD